MASHRVGEGVRIAIVIGMVLASAFVIPGGGKAASFLPCPGSATGSMAVGMANSPPIVLNPCPGGEWAKIYVGLPNATTAVVQPTADGGYVVVGETDLTNTDWDIWGLKVNATGTVEWQYQYGGPGRDRPYKILQTPDGGYILLATLGLGDAWILKLDASGGIQWQKAYGGSGSDALFDIRATADGGYVLAGMSNSHRPGVEYWGSVDAWILKLDSSGNVRWQKAYGSATSHECATSIQEVSDGFIVAGSLRVWGFPSLWVFKLTTAGSLVWQKEYGGRGGSYLCATQLGLWYPQLLKTSDGGSLIESSELYQGGPTYGTEYGLVTKVDAAGKVLWQRSYETNGTQGGWLHSLALTSDGGSVVAGLATDAANIRHPWVLRLDSVGNVQWQKTYGLEGGNAAANSVRQTPDGGFILGVWTLTSGMPSAGLVVMKLDGGGNAGVCTDATIGADAHAVVRSTGVRGSGNNAKATNPSTTASNTAVTPSVTNALESQLCTS